MSTKPDHFNHDAHVRRLEDASNELYRHGDSEIGPASAGDLHAEMQITAREVRRAVSTLRSYVAQPDAPWITPTPVMFPRSCDEET
jgi:hypothetical protein